MWPSSSGTAWTMRLHFISRRPGQTWHPSVTNRKRRYAGTLWRSRNSSFSSPTCVRRSERTASKEVASVGGLFLLEWAAAAMSPIGTHRVESLRCEGSDAIGAKRTCRERRERIRWIGSAWALDSGSALHVVGRLPLCRSPRSLLLSRNRPLAKHEQKSLRRGNSVP